ncbi:MAG: hypothetical protein ACXVRA_10400 [Gaiellaceae bacterium]
MWPLLPQDKPHSGAAREVADGRAIGRHWWMLRTSGTSAAAGVALAIGTGICGLAGPGQVLVSRTVTSTFAGDHALKGVPDRWQLYAVAH